jgi:hypothetical protein
VPGDPLEEVAVVGGVALEGAFHVHEDTSTRGEVRVSCQLSVFSFQLAERNIALSSLPTEN